MRVKNEQVEFSIRPATQRDVGFLTEVVVEATRAQGRWPADFDEAEFRRTYETWTATQVEGGDANSTTSVIAVAGQAVGRLRVLRDDERIDLAGIQLLPKMQGHGIGTRIIEDLKSEATRAGIPLDISVEHDNPRARMLYERLGLVKIDEDAMEVRLRWRA